MTVRRLAVGRMGQAGTMGLRRRRGKGREARERRPRDAQPAWLDHSTAGGVRRYCVRGGSTSEVRRNLICCAFHYDYRHVTTKKFAPTNQVVANKVRRNDAGG